VEPAGARERCDGGGAVTRRAAGAAGDPGAGAFLAQCDELAERGWRAIHAEPFWQDLLGQGLDRPTYVALLAQIFHYTRHNAQNQAQAAISVGSDRLPLLRFCLQHAFEEAGHDLMVLSDLAAIGVDPEEIRRSEPLPETQAFVAWLYRIATERDATARLGYSYWAESCYAHIAPLLAAMRRDLGLEDRQMTFFVAHSAIDREHYDQVRRIAAQFCDTEERRRDMRDVLRTSLALTGGILEGVRKAMAAHKQPV
jgi:thiaminase